MNPEKTKDMPQMLMTNILKDLNKLAKMEGATVQQASIESTKNIVSNKLVWTFTLKAGKSNLAQIDIIDPRTLAEIKAKAQQEKENIQAKSTEAVSDLDSVITLVS